MASTHASTTPSTDAIPLSAARPQQQQRGRRNRGGRNNTNDPPEVRLSKLLSFALRHGAAELQLNMLDTGYVALPELLAHRKFRAFTLEEIEAAVRNCPKQRFALLTDASGASTHIRANQGHSLARVQDAELLEPLVSPDAIDECIHGTYVQHWPSIHATGLSRMTRNHIHCTTRIAPTGDVVSGMRTSCTLLVYIDYRQALADGVKFYKSSNNVVLTPGVGDTGVLPLRYIRKAINRKSGLTLYDRTTTEQLNEAGDASL